jgi:hypothetical protein
MSKGKIQNLLVLAPVFVSVCLMAGCAAKTAPVWGDPQTGLILQYRMPEGQVLKYESWGETHQTMEVMGQTIDVDMDSTNAFSVASKGQKEKNHQLTITIDGMSIKIQSPQAELEADMSSVIGKSFDMVLSSLGEELELIGAEAIEYDMGPEGTRNIAAGFQDIFPAVADRPVKVGDTWPDESIVTDKSSSGEALIKVSSVNTMEGFETIDGLECVRISAKASGTIEGTGEQQGMELITRGDIKGTATWYFAYKEGLFVKQTIDGSIEGMVNVPSQNIDIPFTREMTSEIKLVK